MTTASSSRPVIGLITARGGSKGIPGKNIKPMAGRPMIAWTVAAACAARSLERVLVSTDDPGISAEAARAGAEVPFLRPAHLAEDKSPHLAVVEHALDWLRDNGGEPEFLCLLQPTSPLRTAADIDAAVGLARETGAPAVIGVTGLDRHPFLAKKLEADGTLADFVPSDLPYLRRQDLPPAYAINGAIYINRVESIRRDRTLFPRGSRAYVMPAERSLDVDTPLDFFLVEQLLRHGNAAV